MFSRIAKSVKRIINRKDSTESSPKSDKHNQQRKTNGNRSPKKNGSGTSASRPSRSNRGQSNRFADSARHDEARGDDRGQRRSRERRSQPKEAAPKVQRTGPPMASWTPPGDQDIPPDDNKTRFIDLDIPPEILRATIDNKFQYCTPVQQECLPHSLAGKDVAGKAQTGTGKTAAFLISIFTRFLRTPQTNRAPGHVRALVLAPTRELAIQIHKDAEALGKYGGFHNVVVYGGMDHQKQRSKLDAPVDLLVATPGRLLDFMRSRHAELSDVEVLVIDEADRMLDMGFIPDVRRIVSRLPSAGERQTMFFSATLTSDILRLVGKWLVNPLMLEIDPENIVVDLIDEVFYSVTGDEKLALLLWLIQNEHVERMLIFANRRADTDQLNRRLHRYGIDSELLSGDVAQKARLRILEDFRSGKTKILVATDVAGRGIHVDNISHVVNYELPFEVENYVHRIGRTGRAGVRGKAISFACEFGGYLMPELEEYLDREIQVQQPEESMIALPEAPPRRGDHHPDQPEDGRQPRSSAGGRRGGPSSNRRAPGPGRGWSPSRDNRQRRGGTRRRSS